MATTNLNLTTIAGTDSPANFPATYNDALDKIDAFAGNMASAAKYTTVTQNTSGATMSYEFTNSCVFLMIVSRVNGGDAYMGMYIGRTYLRSGSNASSNLAVLKTISAPTNGISGLTFTASTTEQKATLSCTTTATYMRLSIILI